MDKNLKELLERIREELASRTGDADFRQQTGFAPLVREIEGWLDIPAPRAEHTVTTPGAHYYAALLHANNEGDPMTATVYCARYPDGTFAGHDDWEGEPFRATTAADVLFLTDRAVMEVYCSAWGFTFCEMTLTLSDAPIIAQDDDDDIDVVRGLAEVATMILTELTKVTAQRDQHARAVQDHLAHIVKLEQSLTAARLDAQAARLALRVYENGSRVNQPLVDDIERWRRETEAVVMRWTPTRRVYAVEDDVPWTRPPCIHRAGCTMGIQCAQQGCCQAPVPR